MLLEYSQKLEFLTSEFEKHTIPTDMIKREFFIAIWVLFLKKTLTNIF